MKGERRRSHAEGRAPAMAGCAVAMSALERSGGEDGGSDEKSREKERGDEPEEKKG
jgi:hypothetical protein